VAKSVRAAEAIAVNPRKSKRAIADDLGISEGTVRSVRNSGAEANPIRLGSGSRTIRMFLLNAS
jgi:hypothetical protein